MRDLDDWQRMMFGVNEPPDEKPVDTNEAGKADMASALNDIRPQGVPTVDLHCQLCSFVSPVMASFEGQFYLEHVDIGIPEDRTRVEVRHYVRAVPRER